MGFLVKKWKMGVFLKKVENVGCCFGKKVENGVFFCKKVDLSSTQGALCTVSVFFILHFIYLGVRTQTFYVKIKYDGVIVAQCNYSVLQKKYTTHPPLVNLTVAVRLEKFLVQLLLSEYHTEKWLNFTSHLFSVRTLPWEILTPRKSQTER